MHLLWMFTAAVIASPIAEVLPAAETRSEMATSQNCGTFFNAKNYGGYGRSAILPGSVDRECFTPGFSILSVQTSSACSAKVYPNSDCSGAVTTIPGLNDNDLSSLGNGQWPSIEFIYVG